MSDENIKGMLDLANHQRLAEYKAKLHDALCCRRVSDEVDDSVDAVGLVCAASLAAWAIIAGAIMVYVGFSFGWFLTGAGAAALIMVILKINARHLTGEASKEEYCD